VGGAGNDTYVLAMGGDMVVEAAGGGTDQVNAAVTAALAANVENLVLTGSAAIHGTGNELANRNHRQRGQQLADRWGGQRHDH
jgi:Ca2+-binding RTX toxin-like protein